MKCFEPISCSLKVSKNVLKNIVKWDITERKLGNIFLMPDIINVENEKKNAH